jgi:hypothetical protein
MPKTTYINVWASALTEEKEVELSGIVFKDGYLFIENVKHDIIINGDDRNIPKGFVPDFGDGFPRIMCDWKGTETEWMLDDVTLVPFR